MTLRTLRLTWRKRLVLGVHAYGLLAVAYPAVGVVLLAHEFRGHPRAIGPSSLCTSHVVLGIRGEHVTFHIFQKMDTISDY